MTAQNKETYIDQHAANGVMIINGQTVNLFNLKPEQIEISKMVKGLQGVIRFNGYSDWSVAEHSFFLSHLAENVGDKLIRLYYDYLDENSKIAQHIESIIGIDFLKSNKSHKSAISGNSRAIDEIARTFGALMAYDALIHDFSEALTGDIIRPLKRCIAEISEVENKVDSQIRAIHHALPEMPKLVDILDKQLASIEAYYMTRFYSKTIINDTDEFQTYAFNSVFGEENVLNNFVAKTIFNIDLGKNLAVPLTFEHLQNFTSYSSCSIGQIKAMSKEELLIAYCERASKLRSRIEL